MGIYLNPGNGAFLEMAEKELYVDKSLLIQKLYENSKRLNKYVCVSRPRRFGKSTDANMISAYFSKGCDSRSLFDSLKIAGWDKYGEHINAHNVIQLNMQTMLSATNSMEKLIDYVSKSIVWEIAKEFADVDFFDSSMIVRVLDDVYSQRHEGFIFIIDEWDCVFREYKDDKDAQKKYLDYLRLLLKDHAYVELAYMTGILPIRKYGTHSALNMFDEISMIDCYDYSGFMGLTDGEVHALCEKFGADYGKMVDWYDGYTMRGGVHTYSPRSVTAAIAKNVFTNYWSQTETYDALKVYIDLNYDDLKDTIVSLIAGKRQGIDPRFFQNTMTDFVTKDDVLTLLVHLGYLAYDYDEQQVYIPNREVLDTFVVSIKNSNWNYATKVFQNSRDLLEATWQKDAVRVAAYIENSHYETSVLQYNDENALAYTVNLAYIVAKQHYTLVRELPTGKGFADIAFIPHGKKPAMLVELKYDKNADAGIRQIKEKKYFLGLENYLDNLLLVAISYDKSTKKHECVIENYRESAS